MMAGRLLRRYWRHIAVILICGIVLDQGCERILERQRFDITRKWARLAPYPESARELSSVAGGSLFTRSFRVTFTAPLRDINDWLRASPGTRAIKPERTSDGERHFDVVPGGGAQHAEVTVDDASGYVVIFVYWS